MRSCIAAAVAVVALLGAAAPAADALPPRCTTAQVCLEGEINGTKGTSFRVSEPDASITLRAVPRKWGYLIGHGGAYTIGLSYGPPGLGYVDSVKQGTFWRGRCADKTGGCVWKLTDIDRSVEIHAWLVYDRRNRAHYRSAPVTVTYAVQSWAGQWQTDYGLMVLDDVPADPATGAGGLTAGSIEHCTGVVTATAATSALGERYLTGIWDVNDNDCGRGGESAILLGHDRSFGGFQFVMSADGCSFTGVWWYPPDPSHPNPALDPLSGGPNHGLRLPWNGRRVSESCP